MIYDFLILGGGSAGYAAARTAHDLGLSVAVVDGAEKLGGLCILRGCMPSKSLLESANRMRAMRRAKEFGLRAEGLAAYPEEIIQRKRGLIQEFADYRSEQLQDGRFELIRGSARFVNSHTVEVSPLDGGAAYPVQFSTALIATGSSISPIPVPGLEEAGYWTSDDILDAESVPDDMIVLGGGAIALEMACYLEGIGRRVSLIQRSAHVLKEIDPDVTEALEEALGSRDNFSLYTDTHLLRVEVVDGEKVVHFEHKGETRYVKASQILLATGRLPNTYRLDLERVGIEVDGAGRVLCTPDQRSSVPHIYAAGDACGPHEIVHIAIEQGEIAASNAAVALERSGAAIREIDYRLKLLGVFTDPQIATVGLSEAEAAQAGIAFATASYPFDDHGKSMLMGEIYGFVKLIVNQENGEIIGGSVVGPEAVELIHEIVVAMHFRSTAGQLLQIPHYHPTLSEIWTYPAEELSNFG